MKKICKYLLLGMLTIYQISCSTERAVFETNFGEFTIEVDRAAAPKHAENFIKLINDGFYNGVHFHRIVKGFIIQGGDPLSKDSNPDNDGTGGPGYLIPAEIKLDHIRGSVAAARMGDKVNPQKKSNGSQFYICLTDLPALDNEYSVFGKVTQGMDVIDKIGQIKTDHRERPQIPVIIKKAYIK